ncbi:MAG: hypothetical protein FJX59_13330 [Alphaproteobacteria bacterium]|nr:hypothetical protein [Alphaproteobacteria bacterium]
MIVRAIAVAALAAALTTPSFADEQSLTSKRIAEAAAKTAAERAAKGGGERPRGERTVGRYTGYEGKERDLGLIMNMVYKTLEDNDSYQHEVNDALVKSHLSHMQFAKDNNLVAEGVQHEIDTEEPMLRRVGKMIEKSGDKELALKAVFDQTTCHWQLVLDTEMKPGMRRYRSPWTNVLTQTTRLGQHDITEQWIHENWTIPRMKGYSKLLGVELEVSPWRDDGMITVSIKDGANQASSAVTQ